MKKQLINEVEQFQKIAGIKKEGYMDTPYDSSEDMAVDMINKGIKEDADTQGRTSYDLVKGPNEDPLVKRILVNLHNKYGKEGYHYDPYMNRLTIHGEANEDGAVVDMLSALFDQPEYQDLSEDDYGEDPSSDMDDESQSGDTDAMGIDEAGNVKGIKIEIPGNSYASDFGKAAAREVIESFGPREYRSFLEAFLNEFKKLTKNPKDFGDISEEESAGEKVSIPTQTVKGLDGKTYNLITLYQNTRNGLRGQTYSLDKPYTFTGVVDQENEQYQNVKLDSGYENIGATIFVKQPKNGQHLLEPTQKLADIYQIHKGSTTFRKY